MARRPRLSIPDVPHHVIQRGNNRQPCFFVEDDYQRYLRYLSDAAWKCRCSIHAYVLMTNHVHLLVTPDSADALSRMMQQLGRRYVRYVNDAQGRTGTLWEGRFRASVIDSETYFLRCCCYIELNPVRADIAGTPDAYPWSSYRCHGLGSPDPLVRPHDQLERLGTDPETRQSAYRDLIRTELKLDELREIRETANQGRPLGSTRFRDRIARALSRAGRRGRLGHARSGSDGNNGNSERHMARAETLL